MIDMLSIQEKQSHHAGGNELVLSWQRPTDHLSNHVPPSAVIFVLFVDCGS